jgi:FMN phosphatase YigB (HAD superfamily)
LNATPEETLFIDDSPDNVVGAVKAGLGGYLYTDLDALRVHLKQIGVL